MVSLAVRLFRGMKGSVNKADVGEEKVWSGVIGVCVCIYCSGSERDGTERVTIWNNLDDCF